MTQSFLIGICELCGEPKRVPAYSFPPKAPSCACSTRPNAPQEGTGVLAFDRELRDAYDIFRSECEDDDVRDTIIRMQSFLAMIGTAYNDQDGKTFLSGLISLAALAKVLSTTVDEEDDDDGEDPAEEDVGDL